MTVDKLMILLETMPSNDEVAVVFPDDDGEPFYLALTGVTQAEGKVFIEAIDEEDLQ